MLSRAQNTFHHNPRLRGPVSSDIDVWRELHGQVSLAAVNQILCRSWGY